MKDRFSILLLLLCLLGFTAQGFSQDTPGVRDEPLLFSTKEPLELKLQYSHKVLKKDTNDSTYIRSVLVLNYDGLDSIPIEIRARGKFRRDYCYFIPVKIKISKKKSRNTLFQGNRKFKLVLPCLMQKHKNDYVLKEYFAYALFEQISPYYFKTRLANIEFIEEKGRRQIKHRLKGFIIEDSDGVEARFDGKEMKQEVHPLQQDDTNAIRNNLFQFMIGNTDYSILGGHNEKLFYLDGKYISLPYDFDLSGLVNASYATVSGAENLSINITEVTQRAYKGYKRDRTLMEQVRREILSKKEEVFKELQILKQEFESKQQFADASRFLIGSFKILENETQFERQIVKRAREN